VKINYQDSTNAAATQIKTAQNALRDALGDLRGVQRDISDLTQMPPVDEHDFLHRANVVKDPKGEIVNIKSDLKTMLTNIDRAETSMAKLRVFLKKLLE
jgi:hypothetical protein